MQKVINALAVISFVGTTSIIGAGAVVYLQRDSIVEGLKERAAGLVTTAVMEALPLALDGGIPEIPEATGGAVPLPVVPF